MPDGTIPYPGDPARAALDAARRNLETELANNPDWIALGAMLSGDTSSTTIDQAALEARLETIAAYRALRDLDRAAALLPNADREPRAARAHEVDFLVPRPADIQDATIETIVREASEPAARDDLTRIRGIDVALAGRLAAIGICRFEQIAGWSMDDVRTIAQGLGLGRNFVREGVADQAAALLRQRAAPTATAKAATGSTDVSTWSGRADVALRPVTARPTMPPALMPAVRQSVLARIRRGPRDTGVVPLTVMAPELGEPIFIACEASEPELKPRWLPRPMESVLPPDRVMALPAAQLFETARLAPPAAVTSPLAPLEPEPVEPIQPPLHVRAARRLDDIEAEIAALAERAAQPGPVAATVPSPAVLAARMRARRPADLPDTDLAPEAEIEIIARAPRAPALEPLPGLPLAPKTRRPSDQVVAIPLGDIEEAAVTIVRAGRTAPRAVERPALTNEQRRGLLRSFFRLPGRTGELTSSAH